MVRIHAAILRQYRSDICKAKGREAILAADEAYRAACRAVGIVPVIDR